MYYEKPGVMIQNLQLKTAFSSKNLTTTDGQ
jgi:hypothetical protein